MRKSLFLYLFLIALLFVPFLNLNVYATEFFSDGFESGNFSAWTLAFGTGTAEVIAAAAHHGIWGAHFSVAGVNYKKYDKSLAIGYTELYIRAYAMFKMFPAVAYHVFPLTQLADAYNEGISGLGVKNDGGTVKWCFEYRTGGTVEYLVLSGITPLLDTWYCLEIYTKIGDADGVTEIWVNGGDVWHTSQTGLDNNNAGNLQRVGVGCCRTGAFSCSSAEVYVDCVVVADAYIGVEEEGQTFRFFPSTNLIFTLNNLPKFYGTYFVSSSIDVKFNVYPLVNRFGTFLIYPSINMRFDLSSGIQQYLGNVYNIFSSTNLIFHTSSNTRFFGFYHVFPSINLKFNINSITQIFGVIHRILPSITLTFDISKTQDFWGTYIINPHITIKFNLPTSLTGGIIKGYEINDAILLGVLAFILSIMAIVLAVALRH